MAYIANELPSVIVGSPKAASSPLIDMLDFDCAHSGGNYAFLPDQVSSYEQSFVTPNSSNPVLTPHSQARSADLHSIGKITSYAAKSPRHPLPGQPIYLKSDWHVKPSFECQEDSNNAEESAAAFVQERVSSKHSNSSLSQSAHKRNIWTVYTDGVTDEANASPQRINQNENTHWRAPRPCAETDNVLRRYTLPVHSSSVEIIGGRRSDARIHSKITKSWVGPRPNVHPGSVPQRQIQPIRSPTVGLIGATRSDLRFQNGIAKSSATTGPCAGSVDASQNYVQPGCCPGVELRGVSRSDPILEKHGTQMDLPRNTPTLIVPTISRSVINSHIKSRPSLSAALHRTQTSITTTDPKSTTDQDLLSAAMHRTQTAITTRDPKSTTDQNLLPAAMHRTQTSITTRDPKFTTDQNLRVTDRLVPKDRANSQEHTYPSQDLCIPNPQVSEQLDNMSPQRLQTPPVKGSIMSWKLIKPKNTLQGAPFKYPSTDGVMECIWKDDEMGIMEPVTHYFWDWIQHEQELQNLNITAMIQINHSNPDYHDEFGPPPYFRRFYELTEKLAARQKPLSEPLVQNTNTIAPKSKKQKAKDRETISSASSVLPTTSALPVPLAMPTKVPTSRKRKFDGEGSALPAKKSKSAKQQARDVRLAGAKERMTKRKENFGQKPTDPAKASQDAGDEVLNTNTDDGDRNEDINDEDAFEVDAFEFLQTEENADDGDHNDGINDKDAFEVDALEFLQAEENADDGDHNKDINDEDRFNEDALEVLQAEDNAELAKGINVEPAQGSATVEKDFLFEEEFFLEEEEEDAPFEFIVEE